MKTGLIIFFAVDAVVLGAVLGMVVTWNEFSNEQGVQAAVASPVVNSSDPAVNRVGMPAVGEARLQVIGTADFDFGVMEKGEKRSHTFVIKNVGDDVLTLQKPKTSCKCTSSNTSDERVSPGATTEIELNWEPYSFSPDFRQTATLETNDPTNKLLTLQIHGRVIQTIRAAPEDIVMSNISANEEHQSIAHVYCYRTKDVELTFDRFAKPELADSFDVTVEPLPPDEVTKEPYALAGFEVSVTLKPGLPLGPISQSLYFRSNLDTPDLEIPIRGTVSGDISVLAGGGLYDSEHRIITLGGVPRATGEEFLLHLLVKGSHADQTKLSVGEVDPADVLQVRIDPENRKPLGKGYLYPMTVTIPPNSPVVSRLGTSTGQGSRKYGKILINATHPVTKEILLYVKFAVDG